MDTSDTMLTMVIPGANDKDFVVYYEMAEPVGHFRTMAEIYRINEKTVDLVAASVNGKPPRFGGRASGRALQGNGSDKISPQPNISCGGCVDLLNGPWEYESAYCMSFDTGCLANCASQCAIAAGACAGCYETHDWKICSSCVGAAYQCAHCGAYPNLCCNHWASGCTACAAP